MPRQYKSIFVPGLEITVAEYLTEGLIKNFCSWQKKQLPKCPFWKKEYQDNQSLKELGKRYIAELSYVHNLLKVFSPAVLSEHIHRERGPVGMRLVKQETRMKTIYALYEKQVKYLKSFEGIKDRVSEFERADDKQEFLGTKTFTGGSKQSKMSL